MSYIGAGNTASLLIDWDNISEWNNTIANSNLNQIGVGLNVLHEQSFLPATPPEGLRIPSGFNGAATDNSAFSFSAYHYLGGENGVPHSITDTSGIMYAEFKFACSEIPRVSTFAEGQIAGGGFQVNDVYNSSGSAIVSYTLTPQGSTSAFATITFPEQGVCRVTMLNTNTSTNPFLKPKFTLQFVKQGFEDNFLAGNDIGSIAQYYATPDEDKPSFVSFMQESKFK